MKRIAEPLLSTKVRKDQAETNNINDKFIMIQVGKIINQIDFLVRLRFSWRENPPHQETPTKQNTIQKNKELGRKIPINNLTNPISDKCFRGVYAS